MNIILFIVSVCASTLGAIVGFGGGVVIKPVLDAIGILPVNVISFLSGCTVLTMSVVSLFKGRNDGVKLDFKISTPLAIGSVIGGITGKKLFQFVQTYFNNENILGLIQALLLVIITVGVYLYVVNKEKIKSYNIKSSFICVIIGVLLGIISSFLGIGGDPNNIAILFLCFSMYAKEAAKNSIYTIMFSQAASLCMSFIDNSIPSFSAASFILMLAGGVGGAIIGGEISKKIDSKKVEKLLRKFILLIIFINIFNAFKFAIG